MTKLWCEKFQKVRQTTAELCRPLETEDFVIQSITDVSPPKWHLAHTTWFFETFVLLPQVPDYQPYHPGFHELFNSYYQTIGKPFLRAARGLLSRPTVKTIFDYRRQVDEAVIEFVQGLSDDEFSSLSELLELALHHEQQHQELLLMDIKHNFSIHPDQVVYRKISSHDLQTAARPLGYLEVAGGLIELGASGQGFCFDNELPRHNHYLGSYQIADRLITNQEYLEFIEDNGYQKPEYWLSDGWDKIKQNQWTCPLYWQQVQDRRYEFTLLGLTTLNPQAPVTHVSFYEADAYARWRGCRLPSEAEWEHVVEQKQIAWSGNFLENQYFHPQEAGDQPNQYQFFGDLWEWTASPYVPYPGYQPLKGPLGEYNGKFMSNTMVMRGGSCVTPKQHLRLTYRNYFAPDKRWQFSGIRLAKDGS